jgi:uncharacterized membrane protein
VSHTSKNFNIVIAALLSLAIFLTACGAQPAAPQAASPTQAAVVPTQAAVATQAEVAPTQEVAPATEMPAATGGSVSFTKDVLPILESRCLNCHGGEKTSAGLSVATYDKMMAGSENGAVIVPGDADNSLLVKAILAGKMPKRGPKLLPDQTQVLIDWIKAGAQNN